MAGYEPGACNIGKAEIRKRYALAVAGFLIAAAFAYAVAVSHMPRWALFFSAIPLILGFEGFYQGYLKFCAGFAAKGIYDFKGSGGERGKVKSKEEHWKDMKKAVMIHLYALISGAIVTVLVYILA
jgi:hypothetical protein